MQLHLKTLDRFEWFDATPVPRSFLTASVPYLGADLNETFTPSRWRTLVRTSISRGVIDHGVEHHGLGIVDENINFAERRHRLRVPVLHTGRIGTIGVNEERPPSAPIVSSAARPIAALISAMTTDAPQCAIMRAVSRPMPCPAPVTTATLFCSAVRLICAWLISNEFPSVYRPRL
jgi:hypothetical protein